MFARERPCPERQLARTNRFGAASALGLHNTLQGRAGLNRAGRYSGRRSRGDQQGVRRLVPGGSICQRRNDRERSAVCGVKDAVGGDRLGTGPERRVRPSQRQDSRCPTVLRLRRAPRQPRSRLQQPRATATARCCAAAPSCCCSLGCPPQMLRLTAEPSWVRACRSHFGRSTTARS